jgi:hypothetical protein
MRCHHFKPADKPRERQPNAAEDEQEQNQLPEVRIAPVEEARLLKTVMSFGFGEQRFAAEEGHLFIWPQTVWFFEPCHF